VCYVASFMVVLRYADATLPTAHGVLRTVVYREASAGQAVLVPAQDEHLAIVAGEVQGADEVLCRVHSECWTGETLGSLKCDCRAQLDASLLAIVEAGRGVVVYLRQEGRGIGLGNKIRAYALQNEGKDTVEANEALGFHPDLRSYALAAAILRDLEVRSVALMTNNPDKLAELEKAGVHVQRRVPHWVDETRHNQDYLAVKRSKLGHHI
jgi:GTP cyclohydrolase II